LALKNNKRDYRLLGTVVKSGALLQKILALKNTLAAIFSGYQNSDLIQRFLKGAEEVKSKPDFY
jgi:hypothetical protein